MRSGDSVRPMVVDRCLINNDRGNRAFTSAVPRQVNELLEERVHVLGGKNGKHDYVANMTEGRAGRGNCVLTKYANKVDRTRI